MYFESLERNPFFSSSLKQFFMEKKEIFCSYYPIDLMRPLHECAKVSKK